MNHYTTSWINNWLCAEEMLSHFIIALLHAVAVDVIIKHDLKAARSASVMKSALHQ